MHGRKRDIDLNFLNGRELVQLGIGLYQTVFTFDEDVAISVEGEFRYFDGQDNWIWQPQPRSPRIAARACALLGATIERVERNVDSTLAIDFSNGQRLILVASDKGYESYDITRPGRTIVV